jgi:hypothetical protein
MQTLSILGAILLVSITALNMHRNQTNIRQVNMRAEVEMRATGVATWMLDHLDTLPFDANHDATRPSELTHRNQFGGASSLDSATDLDDVDGLTFVTSVASSGGPLLFDVSLSVRYVEPSGGTFAGSGGTRTRYKEVSLNLRGPAHTQITIQQIYALGA